MAEENWKQMIIWNFFLLKSAWRGRIAVTIKRRTNRSTEEIAAAKKRAEERQFTHWWKPQNCLEKDHKSAARARNCRLRPRSSRRRKRQRLTYRQFSDPGLEVTPALTYTSVCSVLLPWPSLQLLLPIASLQWLLNAQIETENLTGAYWHSFRVVFFHVRISKAVGLFPTCLHFVQAHFVF